jgi:IclR family acetate operon transcriptional repressor
LGETAARPRDLRKVALASMSDLRNAVNLTVHLAVLERGEVVYIEILPARGTPRLPSRVGGRMPAHATGVGKALLAHSDSEIVDEIVDGGLRKVGPRTITDPGRLRRELARIRSTGIAYEREESGPGIACAAAFIRGASGEPVAAISAAGWDADFDVRRVGFAVQTAAMAISREVERRPGLRL